MKKIYFLMGALAVSMLSACHNHDHEEEHTHGTEETAREDNHEEHADEIILTAEKAKAAGIATETVKRDTFRQIIKTGGQILAAQGEETHVSVTRHWTLIIREKEWPSQLQRADM